MSQLHSNQRHIIGRVILELNTGNLADVWSLQAEVSRIFQQQAVPELERLFDRWVGVDQVVRLDQVVVDTRTIDRQFLQEEFIPQLLHALEQTLNDTLQHHAGQEQESSVVSRDRAGSDWEGLLYFLQYGRLPWWAIGDWQHWLARWQTVVQTSSTWQTPLHAVLTTHSAARQRLVFQLPEAFRYALITAMQPSQTDWLTVLMPTPSSDQQVLWQVAIEQLFGSGSGTSTDASDAAMLLYFLQQGRFPPQQPERIWQDWLDRWEGLSPSGSWQTPLRDLLLTDSRARQRLVEQLPVAVRQRLLLQMQPHWFGWLELLTEAQQILQELHLTHDVAYSLEQQAWLLLLNELGSTNKPLPTSIWIHNWLTAVQTTVQTQATAIDPAPSLRTILTTIPLHDSDLWLTALDSQPLTVQDSEERRDRPSRSTLSPDEETAGLYVTQAGLVLLHPFLRFYLEAVGLVDAAGFRNQLAQQTALYLMYYLATKRTDAPESELVLPKLLCGWDLDEPVVRGLALPESALEEAEHLLQTAIDYWEALKSTSPDGLREGFLQRQGKLTRTNDGNWKLQVEQQAIDILLTRLPWGLSMVTLPWMENLLIVEWT